MDLSRMRESYKIAVNYGKDPIEFAGYIAEIHIIMIKKFASKYPSVVETYFGCGKDISKELSDNKYEITYNINDADKDGNVIITFILNCNDVKYSITRNLD